MHAGNLIISVTTLIFSTFVASAGNIGPISQTISEMHPIVSLFGGEGFLNGIRSSQIYKGTDDDIFVYTQKKHRQTTLAGVFIGFEHHLPRPGLFTQVGVEYSGFEHTHIHGINSVGIEPVTSTLYRYQYTFESQQILAVGKLFSTVHDIYHPYILGGVGTSLNKASRFSATTKQTGSINIAPTFLAHTTSALSYSLGLGLDASLAEHVRIGLGYRLAGLGKSALGNGSVKINNYNVSTPFRLSSSRLYENQVIAQFSYLI